MIKTQKEIFLQEEGDKWFERNTTKSSNYAAYSLLKDFVKHGDHVLEIGCADGLHVPLFTALGADYSGVDPSKKATALAKKTYPKSSFAVGTADALPFEDESFDFVFFGFCFYLIDRSLLMKSVAEADRVLKNKGYLAILDFETKSPCERKYIHTEGVSTYKMDYSSLFTAFPHYTTCFKSVFSNNKRDSMGFEEDVQERLSFSICNKNLSNGYFKG